MDIDVLNEFLILANMNTFADAAKVLDCSPTALRARIFSFEDSLGVKLIERKPHGFELTDAGINLTLSGRKIVDKCNEYIEKGRATAYKEYHHLNIGFTGFEMPKPLQQILLSFCEKYPEVYINLISDMEVSAREGLLSQSTDIFFVHAGEEPYYGDTYAHLIWQAESHIIIPKAHRMSGESSAMLRDFEGERLLLYSRTKELSLREWQVAVRDDSGVPFIMYRSDTSKDYCKYLLSLGKAIMIYPYSGAALPPETVAIPLVDPHIRQLGLYAVYLRESHNPMLKFFLNELEINGLGSKG